MNRFKPWTSGVGSYTNIAHDMNVFLSLGIEPGGVEMIFMSNLKHLLVYLVTHCCQHIGTRSQSC